MLCPFRFFFSLKFWIPYLSSSVHTHFGTPSLDFSSSPSSATMFQRRSNRGADSHVGSSSLESSSKPQAGGGSSRFESVLFGTMFRQQSWMSGALAVLLSGALLLLTFPMTTTTSTNQGNIRASSQQATTTTTTPSSNNLRKPGSYYVDRPVSTIIPNFQPIHNQCKS